MATQSTECCGVAKTKLEVGDLVSNNKSHFCDQIVKPAKFWLNSFVPRGSAVTIRSSLP